MKIKKQIIATRYFFYVLLATVLFSSCGGSLDNDECLSSVKEMFPNAKVYVPFDGSNTSFVVIDSINVYMVETMDLSSPKVTNIKILRSK